MIQSYSLIQWLAFFYIYCFAGWVWESSYVSVKEGHWVNRGFLHGPFLPIYGSGAVVVLLATIPFQQNSVLVILMGMIAATILEYVTGAAMERMFHVRYWDYSNQKLNLNGYICLSSSLVWGVFSIVMIRFVQPVVQGVVLMIPVQLLDTVTILLTIYMAGDVTQSFNEAMDLRAMLEKLTESNETIRKLQKRLDVVVAVAEDNYQKYVDEQKGKPSKKEAFMRNLTAFRDNRLDDLKTLKDKLASAASSIGTSAEVDALKKALSREEKRIEQSTDSEYRKASKILRRNPTAASGKYAEALKQIFHLNER